MRVKEVTEIRVAKERDIEILFILFYYSGGNSVEFID
jgi:hypothetical protein